MGLARLTKKKIEKTQMTKIRNERGGIIIKRMLKACYEQLYTYKYYNLGKMNQFLKNSQTTQTH